MDIINENENENEENGNNQYMNPYIANMFDSIMADEINEDNEDINNNIDTDKIKKKNSIKKNSKNCKNKNEIILSKNAIIASLIYIFLSLPCNINLLEKISPSLVENNYKNILLRAMLFAILYIIITKYIDEKNIINNYLYKL